MEVFMGEQILKELIDDLFEELKSKHSDLLIGEEKVNLRKAVERISFEAEELLDLLQRKMNGHNSYSDKEKKIIRPVINDFYDKKSESFENTTTLHWTTFGAILKGVGKIPENEYSSIPIQESTHSRNLDIIALFMGYVGLQGYMHQISAEKRSPSFRHRPINKDGDSNNSRQEKKGFISYRKQEIDECLRFLKEDSSKSILHFYGIGGMGKTVLCDQLSKVLQGNDVPFGFADGMDPNLTVISLLDSFRSNLGKIYQVDGFFKEYDKAVENHEIIYSTSQMAGGVTGLYNPVGNIKDKKILSDAVRRLKISLPKDVEDILSSRFAYERYKRNFDNSLKSIFINSLYNAFPEKTIPLLIDTYEEMDDMDEWVCKDFYPELPSNIKLVFLGRNDIRKSFDWKEQSDFIHSKELPELSMKEARRFLIYFGASDKNLQDSILEFTGGFPLGLVLIRFMAQEIGGWDKLGKFESVTDKDDIATQILERFLREQKVTEVREILEKGVVAEYLTPEIISVILDCSLDEGRDLYDKLKKLSFTKRGSKGLGIQFHDRVSQILKARLKRTSEKEMKRLCEKLSKFELENGGFIVDSKSQ